MTDIKCTTFSYPVYKENLRYRMIITWVKENQDNWFADTLPTPKWLHLRYDYSTGFYRTWWFDAGLIALFHRGIRLDTLDKWGQVQFEHPGHQQLFEGLEDIFGVATHGKHYVPQTGLMEGPSDTPRVHIAQRYGMAWCIEKLTCLSLQNDESLS